jgi:hypothetical protein
MANATVLRLGANNEGVDKRELFLKVFGGEVLTAFEETQVTVDKQTIRNITSGKTAQFPATWKVNAAYHTPGVELVGQSSKIGERNIHIDDVLIADVFIANIDEAMAHYELRGEYARQCGQALANVWDKNSLRAMVLAARASATITGAFGGGSSTSLTTLYKTSAADLAAGINLAAQTMDEKDIPETEVKFAYVKPAQWYLLSQSTAVQNKDYSSNTGFYDKAKLPMIGNCVMVKTNHLPSTDESGTAVTGEKNTYYANFSKLACVVTTRQAIGTVKLLDLAVEEAYDARRQGTLMLAKYAIGTGILRPEAAFELLTTS